MTPRVKPTQPKFSTDVKGTIAAHIKPALALTVTVLTQSPLDLSVGLDNFLGAELSKGNCGPEQATIAMFHEHELLLETKLLGLKTEWALWEGGRQRLPCFTEGCCFGKGAKLIRDGNGTP